MEKVRPWCGQPSDRGRLKNRTEQYRTGGRPGKNWLDSVGGDCAAVNLTLVEARRVAEDRRSWRTSIHRTPGLTARKDSVVVAEALSK